MSNETTSGSKSFSKFEQGALGVLFVGLFLLPLFFIPSSFILFEFVKMMATVAVISVATLLVLSARLKDGQLTLSKSPLVWSLWAVPVVYFIASLFSAHRTTSLVGYGFEVGTFGFVLLMVTLTALVSYLFRNASRSFSLLASLLVVTLILGLFHVSRFVFGPGFLSFGFFTDLSYNTFGKWYDLSLLFGFAAVVTTTLIEFFSLTKLSRIFSLVLLTLSLVVLAVVNFFMVWVVVAIFSLGLLLYGFFMQPKATAEGATQSGRKLSWVSFVVFVVALFFVLDNVGAFGMLTAKPYAQRLSDKLGISQVEVRPSWTSTMEVISPVLKADPVFGVGPNRFATAWTQYKPAGINAWPFWNVDFSYAIGFIPTAVVTVGVVGALAWLVFLVFLVLSFVKVLRKPLGDKRGRGLTLTLLVGTAFFWFFMIAYVSSTLTLVFTFVVTGLYFAALHREGVLKSSPVTVTKHSKLALVSTVGVVVGLIVFATLGYVYTQKTLASYYFRKGATAFGANDPVQGEVNLVKAFRLGQNDLYLRSLSDFYLAQVNVLLTSDVSKMKPEDVRARFETLFRFANTAANQAVAYDPTNYQNYLTRARVYEIVVPLNIPNAYESAKADYIAAAKLNPQNPLIYLLAGRLEAIKGNIALAKETVQIALTLKPDYADAKTLLDQISAVKPASIAPVVDKKVEAVLDAKATTKKK
ncbi:MAG: hypothetical protein RLZZ347_299 [Candidatus Parcubacteria bacterium]|jgi:hypothetical protein